MVRQFVLNVGHYAVHEKPDQVGIKLRSGAPEQFRSRALPALAPEAWPLLCHGAPGIADGADPGPQRDHVPCQTVRVAGSIDPLVMAEDNVLQKCPRCAYTPRTEASEDSTARRPYRERMYSSIQRQLVGGTTLGHQNPVTKWRGLEWIYSVYFCDLRLDTR